MAALIKERIKRFSPLLVLLFFGLMFFSFSPACPSYVPTVLVITVGAVLIGAMCYACFRKVNTEEDRHERNLNRAGILSAIVIAAALTAICYTYPPAHQWVRSIPIFGDLIKIADHLRDLSAQTCR